MKRILLILAVLLLSNFGQAQTTPNINLNIPPFAAPNWNVQMNQNFTNLDLYLSGNLPLPGLSVGGSFSLSGTLTLPITGSIQCLQVSTGGAVQGAGINCGPTQFAGAPSGICSASQTAINTTNGDFYSCVGGLWTKVGPNSAAANPGGGPNQIQYNLGGVAFAGFTMAGDCTVTVSTGVILCTKTNGSNFVASATTDTTNAANISSGTLSVPRGGTGAASVTGLLKGNGTSPFTVAVNTDVIAVWTGSCSLTTFLRGDGQCATPPGGVTGVTVNQGLLQTGTTIGLKVCTNGQVLVSSGSQWDCGTVSGTGTVTHTAGALTLGLGIIGNGGADLKSDPNWDDGISLANTFSILSTGGLNINSGGLAHTVTIKDSGVNCPATVTLNSSAFCSANFIPEFITNNATVTATLVLETQNNKAAVNGYGSLDGTGNAPATQLANFQGAWFIDSSSVTALSINSTASTWTANAAYTFSHANSTVATVSASQSSPILNLCGTEFHAAASVSGCLNVQFVPGTGTDAANAFNFTHTGSATGSTTSNFPGPVASASDGVHSAYLSLLGNTTAPTLVANTFGLIGPNTASATAYAWQAATAENASAGLVHLGAASSHISLLSVSLVAIADLSASGTPSSTTFLRGDNTWATPAGGGTPAYPVTITGGVSGGVPYFSSTTVESASAILTATDVVLGGGAGAAPNVSNNLTFVSPTLQIGVPGTTTGIVKIASSTATGSVSLTPAASASAFTATLPANTGTVGELNLAQTWSALQTFGTNISIGGVTAAGATGTVNVVFSTSPTLTTPILGVATATSLGVGTSPPTCTAGTGGAECFTEGTAPTAVSATDDIWADSTSHSFRTHTNGGSPGTVVLAEPGTIRSTGLLASVSTATLCAASAGACNQAGTYHVHVALYQSGTACTANTTNGVSFQLTWTDGNGTAHSAQTVPLETNASLIALTGTMAWLQTTLGSYGSGDFNIDTNGTIIQYATTFAQCTTGTATYALSAAVTRLQ